MKEELNKDKLESHFRKQLRDNTPAADGWNMPSDNLWDKLDDELDKQLPQKKKRRWPFFILFPILLFLSGYIAFTFLPQKNQVNIPGSGIVSTDQGLSKITPTSSDSDKNDQLTSTISSDLKDNESKIITSIPTIESKITEKKSETKQTVSVITDPIQIADFSDKEKNIVTKKSISSLSISKNSPKVKDPNELRTKLKNDKAPQQLVNKESIVADPKALLKHAFISLPLLSNSLLPVEQDRLTTDQVVQPNPTISSSKRMTIGVYYAPTISFAKVNDNLSDPGESLNIERNAAYAHRLGLNGEKQVARNWSIGMGLEYTRFKGNSNYNVGVPYSSEDEQQNSQGNYQKNYQHTLPSSFGKLSTEFGLDRLHDHVVPEDELLQMTMSLSHQLDLLTIPLYAKYHIDQQKWQYAIMAGFNSNLWLGNPTTTLTSSVSHHTSIHHRHTQVENISATELNKISFGYLVGIGIRYQLADQFFATVTPTFNGSINTLYKDSSFKNYPYSFSLGLGFQYGF